MTAPLQDLKLSDFLDLLASAAPAPGGGSAAALAGAMGAGLMSMVCRLSIGKVEAAPVVAEVQTGMQDLERLRATLLPLAEADREAYLAVAAARALPKDTVPQQEERRRAGQQAAKTATLVPAKTLSAALTVVQLIHRLHPLVNQNCLSDIGVAMQLAWSAVQGAALNILINLPGTGDEQFNEVQRNRVDEIRREARRLARDTTEKIWIALA